MISTTYEILIRYFVFPEKLIENICLVKIDKPTDDNIIKEIDANNSNRTNTELIYIPVIPKTSKNTVISFFTNVLVWDIFLDKIIHIPIPAKIIQTEWSRKDTLVDTLACSATESTSGSVDVKKGLIAFRYLKLGKGNT